MYIDDIFEVFQGLAVTHQFFEDDLKLFSTIKTSANEIKWNVRSAYVIHFTPVSARSQFKVHTDERTQSHSAHTVFPNGHPSKH